MDTKLYDKETKELLYLGRGMSIPFQLDSSGSVSSSSNRLGDYELVKMQLMHLFGCRVLRRRMLRDWGCNLRKYISEPLDEGTANAVEEDIEESIRKWMKGITIDGNGLGVIVELNRQRKALIITTNYLIIRTQTVGNLVLEMNYDTKKITEAMNTF